jgi:preprotein translocase subunit YajC
MKAQRQEQRKVELGERAQTIGGFIGTVVKSEPNLVTCAPTGASNSISSRRRSPQVRPSDGCP